MRDPVKLAKYLKLADKIADDFSKDPSTKVGAVFISEGNPSPISFGYNGMPRGLDDSDKLRNSRPEKYFWYEHAERNGLYNAARQSLSGSAIFCTKYPTMEEARAIVSSGIRTVVAPASSEPDDGRAKILFGETETDVVRVNFETAFEYSSKYRKYAKLLETAREMGEAESSYPGEGHAALILDKESLAPIKNGFGTSAQPYGLSDAKGRESWLIEPAKNAILNSIRSSFKGSTAITTWCPCIKCSLAMAAAGVEIVATRRIDFAKESDARWRESFEDSIALYDAAGIEFVCVDSPPR